VIKVNLKLKKKFYKENLLRILNDTRAMPDLIHGHLLLMEELYLIIYHWFFKIPYIIGTRFNFSTGLKFYIDQEGIKSLKQTNKVLMW
jgi:hypothetical protein